MCFSPGKGPPHTHTYPSCIRSGQLACGRASLASHCGLLCPNSKGSRPPGVPPCPAPPRLLSGEMGPRAGPRPGGAQVSERPFPASAVPHFKSSPVLLPTAVPRPEEPPPELRPCLHQGWRPGAGPRAPAQSGLFRPRGGWRQGGALQVASRGRCFHSHGASPDPFTSQ